jgi:hypothetical protein
MDRRMLGSSLIEDLNRLACPQAQDRFAGDPERARDALERLLWIDTTQLDRFRDDGWLSREEGDLVERFTRFANERMVPLPEGVDALAFTRAHAGWQITRERAVELLIALDGFIDIGVAGWGRQYRATAAR